MNIYNDRIPFTYLIGWSRLDKWYYGSRYAKGCRPEDLWTRYFTSSKVVSRLRKNHGEPDVIQVRKIFNSIKDTRSWELKVLRRLKVVKSIKWLNQAVNSGVDGSFSLKGYTTYKYKETNEVAGRRSVDDPLVLSGVLVPILYGTTSKESRRKGIDTLVRNGTNKNKMAVRDVETKEIVGMVSTDHYNVKSGKWIPIAKGTIQSDEAKLKKSISNIGRTHWNNGVEQKFVRECPGDGWVIGNIFPSRKLFWNNGVTCIRSDVCPGDDWVRGTLGDIDDLKSKAFKNLVFWNNGIENRRSFESPGEEWVRGRLTKIRGGSM